MGQGFFIWSKPRSGTTFIRLALRAAFGDEYINNVRHTMDEKFSGTVFVNIRNPLDILVSLWRIRHAEYDENGVISNVPQTDVLLKTADTVKERFNHIDKYLVSHKAYILHYEMYWQDAKILLDDIADHIGIIITQEQIERAREATNFEKCKVISESLGSDFDKIDESTDIHGKHIYTGEQDIWKQIIPKEFHYHFIHFFAWELIAYGYNRNDI